MFCNIYWNLRSSNFANSCSIDWHSTSINSLSYIIFLMLVGFIIPLIVVVSSYVGICLSLHQVNPLSTGGRKSLFKAIHFSSFTYLFELSESTEYLCLSIRLKTRSQQIPRSKRWFRQRRSLRKIHFLGSFSQLRFALRAQLKEHNFSVWKTCHRLRVVWSVSLKGRRQRLLNSSLSFNLSVNNKLEDVISNITGFSLSYLSFKGFIHKLKTVCVTQSQLYSLKFKCQFKWEWTQVLAKYRTRHPTGKISWK